MVASSRSAVPISSARAGRRNDAIGIFRIGAKRHHVGGDAAHRPHEHVMQRQIDQRRGDAGDHQRQQQNVDRIAQHRLAQRRLVHDQFDIFAAHRRRTDHAHHVVAGVGIEHHPERIDDRVEGVDVAHVEIVADRRRHVVDRQHAPARAHLHGDGAGADRIRGSAWRARPTPRRSARRRAPAPRYRRWPARSLSQFDAEIGDRRHIDQHFRDHHEQDREDEELSRKTEARRPDRFRPRRGFIAHQPSLAANSVPSRNAFADTLVNQNDAATL